MPQVILPGLLSEKIGQSPLVEVDGATTGHVLRSLEQRYPALRGWVLDEQGRVREHVKVFVNGREASLDTGTTPKDELHIVAAISGG